MGMATNYCQELVLRASTSGRQPQWGAGGSQEDHFQQVLHMLKASLEGLTGLTKGTECDDFSDFLP